MGLRLRELREAHDLSVSQMCERLGVKDSRYRKWESETNAIPIDMACMCADILRCSLDELAGRERRPAAPAYADQRQTRLNSLWSELSDAGRTHLLHAAESEAALEREWPREQADAGGVRRTA